MKKEHVIDRMGGTSEVARICDVTTGAVSQWRKSGIPRARLMFLRLVKPEAFKESGLINAPSQPQRRTHPATNSTPAD